MRPHPYDVAIIGGGPAGLSAGIWLARFLHRVILIDSGDPRNWETRRINGYLGLPGVRPSALRGSGREEARAHGVELVDAICERIACHDAEHFHLLLADGRPVDARRLLLAIGLKDVWPDIPGLEHVYGANAHVCPDCDGWECANRKVVVLGKGRRAVGLALDLTTWTKDMDEHYHTSVPHCYAAGRLTGAAQRLTGGSSLRCGGTSDL